MFNRIHKYKVTLIICTAFIVQHAYTGVIDVMQQCVAKIPDAIEVTCENTYKLLKYIGRGNALEGVADVAVIWTLLNGAEIWHSYLRNDGALKKIQQEVRQCRSEKLNIGDIKEALKEANIKKLQIALHNLGDIEQEIARLESFKKELEPYLTIGGFVGIPQEIKMPLIKLLPNRFHAALERIYTYKVSDTTLQAAYTLQEKINNLTITQLEQMEKAVERHLARWGRVWVFITIKPTYTFACDLYWNCMAKIAYLRKCKTLLSVGYSSSVIIRF